MRSGVDEPVTVGPAGDEGRPIVERLGQLYRHDLSEFRGTTPGMDGLFRFPGLESFFTEPDRRVHLIHHGPVLAGFALTQHPVDGPSYVSAFFVVRALRRRSVGARAAAELLRARPGGWEIAFQEENPGAARFWRRVATELAGPAWREERRPVPDKPWLPPDVWLLLDVPAS